MQTDELYKRMYAEIGSISNHVAIGADWDALSDDALDYAVSNEWWKDDPSQRFDFAAAYRSTEMAPPQISEERLRQSQKLLEEYRGSISPATMMRSLRDHYESGTVFTPGREPGDGKCYSICMHTDPIGTTAASMVAHLRRPAPSSVYWASLGTACCGVFMPLYIEGDMPQALSRAGSEYSQDSAWWLFKRLNQCVEKDFARRTPVVQAAWGEVETKFRNESADVEARMESLRLEGRADQVRLNLTRFMKENLDLILTTLKQLLAEFGDET